MKVIGISGLAGAGKDTFGRMLHEELTYKGFHGVITHYADPLKFILKQFFEWDGVKDERGRHLLQYVGTDVIRAKDPDFWVDFQIKMAQFFGEQWDYMIIPDVRFYNEMERWRECGYDCSFVAIERDFETTLTEAQKHHSSETSLEDFIPDIVIINKTLEDLRESAKVILPGLGF